MTDADLMEEYLSRERAGQATPQGADVEAICADLALTHGRSVQDVRRIVAEYTSNGGAG